MRLYLLNALRWLWYGALVWGFLIGVYALSAGLLLEGILAELLKVPIKLPVLVGLLLAAVAGSALLEKIPLPWAIPLSRRVFSERVFRGIGGRITPLYLRQEFRRPQTWLGIAATAMAGGVLWKSMWPLWVLICQWPVQRALHSGRGWQRMVRLHALDEGVPAYMAALWTSQMIQYALVWSALALGPGTPGGFKFALAGLVAVFSAVSVSLEGDSGRAGLVNLLSLTVGTLAGLSCLASPWVVLGWAYFWVRMVAISRYRLRSVEWFDEDTFVS